MSDQTGSLNIQPANGLVQDAQGRWWEMLSPTQVLTGHEQQITRKKKGKCHGNRKLYHFKRKWRARGLDEEAIRALIEARQQQQLPKDDHKNNDRRKMVSEKRKRDRSTQASMTKSIKSLSQLSISPSASMDVDASSDVGEINLRLHKYSKYLKMPRRLLLRSLRLQLDRPLKREIDQNYILRRLQLIDEHFCVDRIRYLYQSYSDLGSQDQIWPVSFQA